MKMDVEGMEFNILQGAEETLSKTAAILVEEHASGRKAGDFLDKYNYLARRNFTFFDVRELFYEKLVLNLNAVSIKSGPDSNPNTLTVFHPVFINDRFEFRDKPKQTPSSKQEELDIILVNQLEQRKANMVVRCRQLIEYLQKRGTT